MKHPIPESHSKRVEGENLTMDDVHRRNALHFDKNLIQPSYEQALNLLDEQWFKSCSTAPTKPQHEPWQIAAVIEAIALGKAATNTKTDLLQEAMDEHYKNAQTSIVRATIAAMMESVINGMFTIYKTDIPTLTQKMDLTMDLEAQRTIWDRIEMETKRSADETMVTFSIFNK